MGVGLGNWELVCGKIGAAFSGRVLGVGVGRPFWLEGVCLVFLVSFSF